MTKSKPSRRRNAPPTPPPTLDERIVDFLGKWRLEIFGGLLFLFSIIVLLALPGWNKAGWLIWMTSLLKELFGWGAYIVCLTTAAFGLHLALRRMERPYHIRTAQIIGFELLFLTSLPLSHVITNATLADAYLGKGGGLFGWALSLPLIDFFGPFLTGLLYTALFTLGVNLIIGTTWDDLLQFLKRLSDKLAMLAQKIAPPTTDTTPALHTPEVIVDIGANSDDDHLVIIDNAAAQTVEIGKRDPRLPSIDLLEPGSNLSMSDAEIDEKKRIIEQTLADFGLPAEVTQIKRGPAVTQFGVLPGYIEKPGPDGETRYAKVRVSQIASLQKDLALALAAPRLRVQAPVPGQGIVGIEVPNSAVALVRLRAIIESVEFQQHNSPLTVALGRDVSGAPIAVDLAKLPHLLIAGTTGSGKSVSINAFVSCLVFNNPPEKLKIIMVDPKKVELIRFNGLPHLIGNVEVEADRAVGVLRWLTAEMDRRYEMFTKLSARNINSYNRKVGRGKDGLRPLPYIAVFIDELADLMHTYPGDVERTLCRLAQMARATGIHLVVATQRPSTDVITGLIKANFPARLSFAVASGTDSRVILDTVGAEHLLGKGDMLFLAPDASGPARIQGVFMNDHEIEALVRHWQQAMPDYQPDPPPWDSLIARYALLDETDSLLEQAIEIAKKNDTLSTSYLQRRLRIGYPRAARIMEHLYEMGLVEDPKEGGKTRRTFVDEGDSPLDDLLS
jgi:S-DNA-T family DNA segregation ATPase FtsK/SpoIIIE